MMGRAIDWMVIDPALLRDEGGQRLAYDVASGEVDDLPAFVGDAPEKPVRVIDSLVVGQMVDLHLEPVDAVIVSGTARMYIQSGPEPREREDLLLAVDIGTGVEKVGQECASGPPLSEDNKPAVRAVHPWRSEPCIGERLGHEVAAGYEPRRGRD